MQQQQPPIHLGGSTIDPAAQEAHAVSEAFGKTFASQQYGFIKMVTQTLIVVLGWFSAIQEVFIRYEFGERHLSFFRVIIAGFPLFLLWLSGLLAGPYRGSAATDVLFLLYAGAAAYHRWRIWIRYQRRIPWHSYSFGISRLDFLNLPGMRRDKDWALYRWYEPALGGILAAIFLRVDINVGIILAFSAIGAFIKNNLAYFEYRGFILDLIDARITAGYRGKGGKAAVKCSFVKKMKPSGTQMSQDSDRWSLLRYRSQP